MPRNDSADSLRTERQGGLYQPRQSWYTHARPVAVSLIFSPEARASSPGSNHMPMHFRHRSASVPSMRIGPIGSLHFGHQRRASLGLLLNTNSRHLHENHDDTTCTTEGKGRKYAVTSCSSCRCGEHCRPLKEATTTTLRSQRKNTEERRQRVLLHVVSVVSSWFSPAVTSCSSCRCG